MKQILVSDASKNMRYLGYHKVFHKNLETSIELCPHIEYCDVRKMKRINDEYIDCFLDNAKNCQTYKFYNKYGNDWNDKKN